MSNEIKQGDKVRVSKDAPKAFDRFKGDVLEYDVVEIIHSAATIEHSITGDYGYALTIPVRYLVKVDAEDEKPKIKPGDRVKDFVSRKIGTVLIMAGDSMIVGVPYDKQKYVWHIDSVDLVEPTEQTEKTDTDNFKKEAEEWANKVSNAIKEFGDAACKIIIDAHNEAYWDAYTADLAKELVTILVRTRSNDLNKVAKMSVDIAKAVVEGLKRK